MLMRRLRRSRISPSVLEKSRCERVSADLSDAIHLSPLLRPRREQALHAPEPLEQGACGRIGDTRNASQNREPR